MSNRKEGVKERVQKLRDEGYTFEEIGRLLKVSRQRAHQIYKSIEPV